MATYTIKIFPSKSIQFSVIKAFMKALKVKFEVTEEKPYNPEFVKKVLEAEKQIEEGSCTTVSSEEFDKFLWK
jgi:DICT domain-containing protein